MTSQETGFRCQVSGAREERAADAPAIKIGGPSAAAGLRHPRRRGRSAGVPPVSSHGQGLRQPRINSWVGGPYGGLSFLSSGEHTPS